MIPMILVSFTEGENNVIDHTAHIESVVKDEIAKTCLAIGADKNDAGFAIGGFGDVGPMVVKDANGQEQMSFGAKWSLLISFRSLLLGQPRVGGSLPVPGALPTDDEFRAVARRMVMEVHAARDAQGRLN